MVKGVARSPIFRGGIEDIAQAIGVAPHMAMASR